MSVEQVKLLVVLGMHRSGTSVVTHALEAWGVTLGDNLMPPAEDNNERGFFEDLDIHRFNTRLLAALGAAWDRPEAIDVERLLELATGSWFEEALMLLRSKLPQQGIFAFKDPQTSLLLPFWRRVIAELSIDVHYLVCLRNPLSVADSLARRDRIHPARGQLLWMRYLLSVLRATSDQSRLIIDYDALMDQPGQQLRRIVEHLGLPAVPRAELTRFEEEFLSESLRHVHHGPELLSERARVSVPAESLFRLLSQMAGGEAMESVAVEARIVEIERSFGDVELLVRAVEELDCERVQVIRQDDELLRLGEELDNLRTRLSVAEAECMTAWHMHEQALEERHEAAAELARIHASRSWRVMRPLRGIRRHYRNPGRLARRAASEVARGLWRFIPGSAAGKQRFKSLLFTGMGRLFSGTRAYADWQRMTGDGESLVAIEQGRPARFIDEPVQPVPRLRTDLPCVAPARLIAFYLPQFHPIPENDAWWGTGFTEWSNVRPAQPQYEGHYQPHVPGDLGYYDLLDGETQRRQVELAKLYGVSGFCFYFYWFAGKRLLETPLEHYLQDSSLDLPFCLCWANENWSRRWDGQDSQILIAQSYSAEDDLAFIDHVSKYMRDQRYIRIDGKPLLLVYRPGLLPEPKATASRWRDRCRENGVGEIYLAYTQSFDAVAPARYGYDAAIEFPPNATRPPTVTDQVKPLRPDFMGQVFDWSVFLTRSANYREADYKLFRGVCPSWDNTARRRIRSTSFVNSSPRGYQEWLLNAIRNTLEHEASADKQLVFINAWNEWAEGAHLEPDQRYGYGFLEATRMACARAVLSRTLGLIAVDRLAVVVHAYYPDVFAEIIARLNQIESPTLQLYVSCPPEKVRFIQPILAKCRHSWALEPLPNRGRDVLPFLTLLPRVIADGHSLLLKVHTKKSTHRQDGDVWRHDLYDKLLAPEAVARAMDSFMSDFSQGILGPAGHLVPMSYYWGSNAKTVESLGCRLGIRPKELGYLKFVAGTMFFARVDALRPLLNVALGEEDFEAESGQVDGTLAHALERIMSVSAWAAGLEVRASGVTVETPYPFATASG